LFLSLEFVRLSHSLINTVLLCVLLCVTNSSYRNGEYNSAKHEYKELPNPVSDNSSNRIDVKCFTYFIF